MAATTKIPIVAHAQAVAAEIAVAQAEEVTEVAAAEAAVVADAAAAVEEAEVAVAVVVAADEAVVNRVAGATGIDALTLADRASMI